MMCQDRIAIGIELPNFNLLWVKEKEKSLREAPQTYERSLCCDWQRYGVIAAHRLRQRPFEPSYMALVLLSNPIAAARWERLIGVPTAQLLGQTG